MDFLNASFKIGRLFDINIRVHILFLIFIGWRLIAAGPQWGLTLIFLGLLFGIVLLHEFGHCFGARSVGGFAENIMMWPLGGLAYAHAPMTPWAQFVTVVCGPAVNLGFCIVSGAIVYAQTRSYELIVLNPFGGLWLPPGELTWLGAVWIFYQVNLLLLAFNVLPIYPLDGGQLFQCALWPFVGLQRAMTIACQVGLVGCIGLGVWGLAGERGSMLIFIALFGGFTCWQRLRMLRYGMIVDEQIKYAPYRRYGPRRGGGLFARFFKRKPPLKVTRTQTNEEPRERKADVDEEARRAAELDRILKKVHERGLQSLSYVERQVLERATRERQRREREMQRNTRV
jgi:Zn-dependent protease